MYDDEEVFAFLFDLAKVSKDPEGVVAACLLRDGQTLASSASSDDGRYHAEYLVVQQLREHGLVADERCVLYTTLAPCSEASMINDGHDCTTRLLEAGVRHVVFAADDPEYAKTTEARIRAIGGTYRQVGDREIIQRAIRLFNATISRDLSGLHLPRKRKLEDDT